MATFPDPVWCLSQFLRDCSHVERPRDCLAERLSINFATKEGMQTWGARPYRRHHIVDLEYEIWTEISVDVPQRFLDIYHVDCSDCCPDQ